MHAWSNVDSCNGLPVFTSFFLQPYSLKLKIFAHFAGQSKATKFLLGIFGSSLMLGVAGSLTMKNLSVKNRIWLKHERFIPRKF